MKSLGLAFSFLFLFTPPLYAQSVGEVLRLQGTLRIQGPESKGLAKIGQKLYQGDQLETGSNSKAELKLVDGTLIRLSEKSQFTLEEFKYNTQNSIRKAMFSQAQGYFRVIVGKVGMMKAKSRFEVKTPMAIIGVKGTDFFAGPLKVGEVNIALFEGGPVEIKNAGGVLLLKNAGEGVNIQNLNKMPKATKQWPAARLAKAKSLVEF
ncbi:MAG: FecR family protein [SAR324 cluster bacterium]|nr:FecR family protein [SAR324 cluster bacterium]